ncbi:MAG TPA: hypothetical protein PKH24_13830 [Sedimentisphaerales bacterium]|jgi:hypothetical protein|nr:hypothetical protein [Sedimentisphaerales bacterium]HNU28888.1 hypothetical protein [Sedimentisphaerales bacterium]
MRHGTLGRRPVRVVLFGMLLLFIVLVAIPSLDRAHSYPIELRQEAQLRSIDAATELFRNEFLDYPPSDANDSTGKPYCGAMKLAEALMGRDLHGWHSRSAFRQDGLDPNTLTPLYPAIVSPAADTLRARKGPYIPAEFANPCRLVDIYGKENTGLFPEDVLVLCDAFERTRPGGAKTGMPILYYRANRFGTAHAPDDPNDFYRSADNQMLVALGVPGQPGKVHPLSDPNRFYLNTENTLITSEIQPFRRDSYILISAGRDGLYGTADDICNFEWKYREQ